MVDVGSIPTRGATYQRVGITKGDVYATHASTHHRGNLGIPDVMSLTLTRIGEVGGHSVTISLSGEEGIDFLKGMLAALVHANPEGISDILLADR